MQRIETTSTVYTFDGSVLISELKAGRQMSLHDAIENAEARSSLNINGKVKFLMDISVLEDMSLEAIVATVNAKDLSSFSLAAMVVSSTMHRVIAREAKRFSRTPIPTKIFEERSDAEAWIRAVKTEA